MKKSIITDVVLLITAIIVDTLSQLANVTAYVYHFTSSSNLNIAVILRAISIVLFLSFAVLLIYIIVSKVKKELNLQRFEKKLLLSVLCVIIAVCVISPAVVQINYKDYGDDIAQKLKSSEEVTYVHDGTSVSETGKSLFSNKTVSLRIDNQEGPIGVADFISSNSGLILKQYIMQYKFFHADNFEEVTYKDLTIKKHYYKSNFDDLNATYDVEIDSTSETYLYMIEDGDNIFYYESYKIITDNNAINPDEDLENVYQIYSIVSDKTA